MVQIEIPITRDAILNYGREWVSNAGSRKLLEIGIKNDTSTDLMAEGIILGLEESDDDPDVLTAEVLISTESYARIATYMAVGGELRIGEPSAALAD